jgi:glutathionylspermidine synthase
LLFFDQKTWKNSYKNDKIYTMYLESLKRILESTQSLYDLFIDINKNRRIGGDTSYN